MTQMLTPADILPVTAMVVLTPSTGAIRLHYCAMVSPEAARDELGGTLADALLFVEGVCCTECATEALETRENNAFGRVCRSCGAGGCACVNFEDPHAPDVYFCFGCLDACHCRDCDPDD
jgi:hypothetical protein